MLQGEPSRGTTLSSCLWVGRRHDCFSLYLWCHQAKEITWVYESVHSADALMRHIAHLRCKLRTSKRLLLLGGSTFLQCDRESVDLFWDSQSRAALLTFVEGIPRLMLTINGVVL